MPDWFWYIVVFGYGAIVGSFLNVLIYRMPLGLSISSPPSHCPNCRTKLGFWDNVPLFSFLLLGARCRYCRIPISWRYFTVELLTASLWVCLFHYLSGETGVSWVNFVAYALFGAILIAVIFIDLDHFIIPDELNWVGVALGIARDAVCLALLWQAGAWYWNEHAKEFLLFGWLPRSVAGMFVYGGLLLLVSFIGWLYYAREEGETVGQTARRFLAFDDEEARDELARAVADDEGNASTIMAAAETTTPAVATAALQDAMEGEAEEEEGEAVRLRFSPAFLAAVSALLLAPAAGWWAALAFAGPLLAFIALSRQEGEPAGTTTARFFRPNDQVEPGEEPPPAPSPMTDTLTETVIEETGFSAGSPVESASDQPADMVIAQPSDAAAPLAPTVAATASPTAQLAAEADDFAREVESGKHGAMGLGDVKLALAIGAMLGPGPALLSLLIATAAGAVVGITLATIHGRSLRLGIPFGPFMALGALIVILYGDTLWTWYLRVSGF